MVSSDEEEIPVKVWKPLKKNPLTWTECAASGSLLLGGDEIMGGNTGQLFFKRHVLEHIRDYRQDKLSAYHEKEDFFPNLCSINYLRDVRDLKLKVNPGWKVYMDGLMDGSKRQLSKKKENELGRWICPISGLVTDGKNKFFFSWNCGCLVSAQAIEEGPQEEKCLVCEKPYKKWDLVQACPKTQKELELNQSKFLARYMSKLIEFENKKKEEEEAELNALFNDDSESYLEPDYDVNLPSTSRASNSRNTASRTKTVRDRSLDSSNDAGPSTSGTASSNKRQKS